MQLDVGVNANTYARDHAEYDRPNLVTPVYFNTGHKQDASSFVKLAYTAGRATFFGDAQARRAEFRYTPDVHAGISERSISWSFLNPKAGVTYAREQAAVGVRVVRKELTRAGAQRHVRRRRQPRCVERRDRSAI